VTAASLTSAVAELTRSNPGAHDAVHGVEHGGAPRGLRTADAQAQHGPAGDDVGGHAGLQRPDRHDGQLARRQLAAHDGLQPQHNVACQHDGVDSRMGHAVQSGAAMVRSGRAMMHPALCGVTCHASTMSGMGQPCFS
jgi:hypothetical protein